MLLQAMTFGVLQGTFLGPILSLIFSYINDIVENIKHMQYHKVVC